MDRLKKNRSNVLLLPDERSDMLPELRLQQRRMTQTVTHSKLNNQQDDEEHSRRIQPNREGKVASS